MATKKTVKKPKKAAKAKAPKPKRIRRTVSKKTTKKKTTKKKPAKKRKRVTKAEKLQKRKLAVQRQKVTKQARGDAKGSAALIQNERTAPTQAMVRELARMDYAQDQNKCTVIELWEREDRPYRQLVLQNTFVKWSVRDGWTTLRTEYWRALQKHTLNELLKDLSGSLMSELQATTDMISPLEEYMQPIRNKAGEVSRHPKGHEYEGLPIFPLKMPSMKELGDLLLKLYKHRSMTVQIASGVKPDETQQEGALIVAFDPVAQNVDISEEDVSQLADALLAIRQPELNPPEE